jgi:tetratricopeptide (TPR) repeat protein
MFDARFGGFTMTRPLVVLAALLLIAPVSSQAAGGGGGGGSIGGGGYSGGDRSKSDEKVAARKFERAKRHLDEAKQAEAKLEGVTDAEEREDLQDDIEDHYEDARDELKGVVKKQPQSYAAWSELGFSYRKLGDFEESLEAYNKALAVRAAYTPAIEYRGEAYLELGKLPEARAAYDKLTELDGELADMLLGKMQRWLARQKTSPSNGVTPEALAEFESWLSEHKLSDLPPGSVRAAASGW